jgi:ABC-2 type transport system permease protein
MCAARAGRLAVLASIDTPLILAVPRPVPAWRMLPSRIVTFCLVELMRIRHDRTELYTRAIQPVLWLLIYGETFNRLHAIPTGSRPYLDFLAPGIMAQSALFIAIFYGIMIIWERDAGMLTKLLATPTPRAALITGKAFAAGIRGLGQVIVILALSAILRVNLNWNPLHLAAAALVVVVSAGFFACLSMVLAGLVMSRDRLMGIGQAITMPLFFASSALYPIALMPAWAKLLTGVNPLTYEVEALRGLLIGSPTNYALDAAVLLGSLLAGITAAALLLGRLARG